jgi:hypothetical protein
MPFYIRGLVLQGVALESLMGKNRFFLKPGAHAHNFLKIFFIIFFIFPLWPSYEGRILYKIFKTIPVAQVGYYLAKSLES